MKMSPPFGVAAIITLAMVAASTHAQDREVKIETVKLTDQLSMLIGPQSGNIGLCVGDDGVFMIDDQYDQYTEPILKAVAAITDQPVRFLINTHYHGDHTGGNANLAGLGATIVAHDNVRARLKESQRTTAATLPVITFNDEMTFHWNDETIHVFHLAHAHTDGDALIHFKDSNVIHVGDVFFAGMYPRIDVKVGGSIDGMIAAADFVIEMSDAETKIIPGHGPLSDAADLKVYRDMLEAVRNNVATLIEQGKSRDETIAAKPTTAHDEVWGGGFFKPEVFVGWVYDSLAAASD